MRHLAFVVTEVSSADQATFIKRNHLPKIHRDQTSAKIMGSGSG
jgi:hypothetical protein